jgi:hypothetical protein
MNLKKIAKGMMAAGITVVAPTLTRSIIPAAEAHRTNMGKKIGKICMWAIGLMIAVEAISLIEPFTGNMTPPAVAACLPTREKVNGRTVFKCDNRPSRCRRGSIVRINGKAYQKLICRR